jgi:hypothetical protein
LELTQLPDVSSYYDTAGSQSRADMEKRGPAGPARVPVSAEEVVPTGEDGPRWVCLVDNIIKGPFTDDQVRSLIGQGEISPTTSMRMGERPWIQAGQVGLFKPLFADALAKSGIDPLAGVKLAQPAGKEDEKPLVSMHFYNELSVIGPYPVRAGHWQPLAIFVGLAFVLSAILCADLTLGLVINLVGWTILYGYLSTLMRESMDSPSDPPPAWNFAAAKEMAVAGAKVLVVQSVFSLVPVGILLLLVIASFLNGMPLLGYVSIALVVVVFSASLFVVPAALSIFGISGDLRAALNPSRILNVIKGGGRSYLMLVAFSIAAGMACMVVTIISVFLVEIPIVGIVTAGLIMALVFSYGHFIWFHVVGRFSRENESLTSAAV